MDFVIHSAAVTGATGAIGTALIRTLRSAGISVTVYTRRDSERNAVFARFPDITIRYAALDELARLEPAQGEHADVFFHLAWMGASGPGRYDEALQDMNVRYALDAVRLAKKLGCHTFIGAGSQAEYGRKEADLRPDTPETPEIPYGKAKLSAGIQTRKLAMSLGLRHLWMRVLSVYGPNDGKNSMIHSALKKLMDHEALELTEGRQYWDYLYSEDCAKAFLAAARRGKDGSIYVIGYGESRPLREYVEEMKAVCGSDSALLFGAVPYSDTQIMYLGADIEALVKDTQWKPEITFGEGILKCIEDLKETHD